MPLSTSTCHRKTTTAPAIITFIMAWSQFVWLFLVVTTEDMTTIPVGITQVNDAIGGFYARLMSVALPGASRLPSPLWSPGKDGGGPDDLLRRQGTMTASACPACLIDQPSCRSTAGKTKMTVGSCAPRPAPHACSPLLLTDRADPERQALARLALEALKCRRHLWR